MQPLTVRALFPRKSPRVDTDFFAAQVLGDGTDLVRIRDISTSGAFFIKVPEIDSHEGWVELMLVLPGSERPLKAIGRVVRDETFEGVRGIAVEFTRVSRKDHLKLKEFVETYAAAPITRH